jgi:hypothetical protein
LARRAAAIAHQQQLAKDAAYKEVFADAEKNTDLLIKKFNDEEIY